MPAIYRDSSKFTWHCFQPGMALVWGVRGAFGRWKTREENLWDWGGFDPTGLWWNGKKKKEAKLKHPVESFMPVPLWFSSWQQIQMQIFYYDEMHSHWVNIWVQTNMPTPSELLLLQHLNEGIFIKNVATCRAWKQATDLCLSCWDTGQFRFIWSWDMSYLSLY